MDTKALRQKILDLAIRGKLVPQDPSDEPASVLLERIRAEKQKMVKEGKLKAKDIKNDSIIYVGEDNLHYEKFADGSVKYIEKEIPFDLPERWAWARLKDIGKWKSGATPSRKCLEYYDGDIPWVKTGDLNDDYIRDVPEKISEKALKETSVSLIPGDTVLIAMYGATIGKLGITTCDVTTNQACCACCSLNGLSRDFLFYFLMQYKSEFVAMGVGGAQPNISKEKIVQVIVPIPPIEEQNRITAQISKLFACIEAIENDNSNLRFAIHQAKSKILDLAIRGKLVPQDPNDEPASVLLERIREEKEELIKAGKLKRDKKESVIFRGEDNSYYLRTNKLVESLDDWKFNELPDSWTICCLGEVCDYGNCTTVDTTSIEDSAWILDLEDIEKDSGTILQKVRKTERNAISTKHLFHKGQVLYSKLRPYLNKVALADEDGYSTSEILPLEFSKNVIPEYARYYLMSPTFLHYANKCSYGVKMPRLGTTDGKKAIIPLPPINEQKKIIIAIEKNFAYLTSIAENLE